MEKTLMLPVWAAAFGTGFTLAAGQPRVFVLTDIENEPDDAISMVRFLAYCNHWDGEGRIATTSVHQQNRTTPQQARRDVHLPGSKDKAMAGIGMRRSGKTHFMWQCLPEPMRHNRRTSPTMWLSPRLGQSSSAKSSDLRLV